jgi:hypothetical protein
VVVSAYENAAGLTDRLSLTDRKRPA